MGRHYKRLKALEHETLRTLKQGKPFTVEKVTTDVVFVLPAEGTKQRRIDTAKILTMATKGYARDELRQRVFELFGRNWNASYIAAIVHEITKPPTK